MRGRGCCPAAANVPLGVCFLKVFFQAEPLFVHFGCRLCPNVAVVPHFFGCACDVGFSSRVAENKSVLIAVFLQPKVKVICGPIDVYRKPQLVFAISGRGNPLPCLLNRLLLQ